jgi:hypothetical protein
MTEGNLFDDRPLQARIHDAWRRFAAIRPKSPIVRHDSPITSRWVAERLAESDQFRLRLEVLLQAVCDCGDDGVIDDDLICAFPDWPPSSVTATMSRLRNWELVKAGPDTRPTRYGNPALVNRVW